MRNLRSMIRTRAATTRTCCSKTLVFVRRSVCKKRNQLRIKTMGIVTILIMVSIILVGSLVTATRAQSPLTTQMSNPPNYILAGGQNGSWFTSNQSPLLYKTSFASNEPITVSLDTGPSSGTVWSGESNGSDWLVTGWGDNEQGLDPFYGIYANQASAPTNFANYSEAINAEQEWAGGDVFSVTWNGTTWLLTGMGSGILPPNQIETNHYSMAFLTSNGNFVDLSQSIPNNTDGILYASSWDGHDWLVGGGYYQFDTGVLYQVTPSGAVQDITNQIQQFVPEFNAVQSIDWNGTEWMIGGVGFLAAYNPGTGVVYDLTGALDSVLGATDSLQDLNTNSVNSISWIDGNWIFGGGVNVAYVGQENQTAWVATLNTRDGTFADLTSRAIPQTVLSENSMSGILSIACGSTGCALGGFAGNRAVLIWYDGTIATNLSSNMENMTYVQWVGLSDSSASTKGLVSASAEPTTTPSSHNLIPWPKSWHLKFPGL
jgi:hypothetical protein